ncbi:MAG: metal-dependent hydrolase [Nanoarchaeota archaeon]
MLFKTHLVLGFLVLLVFLPFVNYDIIFGVVVLISTMLPDLDSMRSHIGNHWYLRPFQWATKHRGVLHSFSFCAIVSIVFAFIIPVLAFPFFVGYGIHLVADMFTSEGIRPFWPLKEEIEGKVLTGGRVEKGIFYGVILADILLLVRLFMSRT